MMGIEFSRSTVVTLQEMVGHIYGRSSLKSVADRPHMFIRERTLYVNYLRREIDKCSLKPSGHAAGDLREFRGNLLSGMEYYRRLAEGFIEEKRRRFLDDLAQLLHRVELLLPLTSR